VRFHALVELSGKTATGLSVPDDIVAALGPSKRPAVRVTIGAHTYRTTVASMGGRSQEGRDNTRGTQHQGGCLAACPHPQPLTGCMRIDPFPLRIGLREGRLPGGAGQRHASRPVSWSAGAGTILASIRSRLQVVAREVVPRASRVKTKDADSAVVSVEHACGTWCSRRQPTTELSVSDLSCSAVHAAARSSSASQAKSDTRSDRVGGEAPRRLGNIGP